MKRKVIEYSEPTVPVCPVCGTHADLTMLYTGIDLDHPTNPLGSCSHLVTFAPGFNIAEELALFCDGLKYWRQHSLPASVQSLLCPEWAEGEFPAKDPEGDYFIKQFIVPCPAFVRLDYYYQTVGGVGTAGVVATPLIWTSDRSALATQLQQGLKESAEGKAHKPTSRPIPPPAADKQATGGHTALHRVPYDRLPQSAFDFVPRIESNRFIKLYAASPMFWAVERLVAGIYQVQVATTFGVGDKGFIVTPKAVAGFAKQSKHRDVFLQLTKSLGWDDLAVEIQKTT